MSEAYDQSDSDSNQTLGSENPYHDSSTRPNDPLPPEMGDDDMPVGPPILSSGPGYYDSSTSRRTSS